ncbi:hypothetical protein WJX72_010734 [[Myrmecia] bisecta]|uniref:Uncharacterized protein n=1 Tax=[Myrmecia] bisecta TaxID=41462 RepID=A0AAW1PT99_9CHLO
MPTFYAVSYLPRSPKELWEGFRSWSEFTDGRVDVVGALKAKIWDVKGKNIAWVWDAADPEAPYKAGEEKRKPQVPPEEIQITAVFKLGEAGKRRKLQEADEEEIQSS